MAKEKIGHTHSLSLSLSLSHTHTHTHTFMYTPGLYKRLAEYAGQSGSQVV